MLDRTQLISSSTEVNTMAFWNFWKKKSANKQTKPVPDSYFGSEPSPSIKAGDKVLVMTCKHCNERIRPGKQHLCLSGVRGSSFTAPVSPTQDSSNFMLSYIIADATDNMLMGYVVGGSLIGAMLGASAHSHHTANHTTPEPSSDPWSRSLDLPSRSPSGDTPSAPDNSQSEERSSAPSYSSPDPSPSYSSGSSDYGSSSSGSYDSGSSSSSSSYDSGSSSSSSSDSSSSW